MIEIFTMWKKLTFIIVVVCSSCCNYSKDVKSDTSMVCSIDVSEQREAQIDSNDVKIARASVIQLQDNLPIGEILDVALVDSICYFVDTSWSIYGVNISNGRTCYKYVRHGGAELETICPYCITADKNNVYVYDTGKENILVLSSQLVPKKVIRFSISNPLSIKKTEKGFLCMSIEADKQIVHYFDNDGNEVSFQKVSNVNVSLHDIGATIQEGADGYFYAKAMYSDTIYRWKEPQLEPAYVIDYGLNSRPPEMGNIEDIKATKREYTKDFFVSKSGVLSSFANSSNRQVVYNYYNNNESYSKTGRVNKICKIPFIPQWQFGKKIINVFHSEDIRFLKDTLKKDACIELKDEGLVFFMYEFS